MNILYLYSGLAPYMVPVLREYTRCSDTQVHVVHWDREKQTPYVPPPIQDVAYYDRSKLGTSDLLKLARRLQPDIVLVSGWQDKGYLVVARALRKRGTPVVAGIDDQWRGTLRQRAVSPVGPSLLKQFFSHCWVSGPYQYEYAARLGYKKHEIVFNLYSADTSVFGEARQYLDEKLSSYPNAFLFVGRFHPVKGLDTLLEAYVSYRTELNGTWRLICVGSGEMKDRLTRVSGVEVIDYANQKDLVQISRKAGAFILPSHFEAWGVVVHEFAAAALPLILSDEVGARATFLIDAFNGLVFRDGSPRLLAHAMQRISNKDATDLVEMGRRSHDLSKRISPAVSAASFLSIVQRLDT